MQARASQAPTNLDMDVEVTFEPVGEYFQVFCSSCGSIDSPTIAIAAGEIRSWHQQRHIGLRTIHLTLSEEEMRQLLVLARERAQDPEDVVREILTHALEATKNHSVPRPPHLRMVS